MSAARYLLIYEEDFERRRAATVMERLRELLRHGHGSAKLRADEVIVMPNHLGPLELECDAPPYAIVRACRKLGMSEPEDVRWCRKGRHSRRVHGWIQFLTNPIWGRLVGGEAEAPVCQCGKPFPLLESYCFTFQTGDQVEYEMGQCPRCRTIYWEKG